MSQKVAVIGSGFGGLALAIRLQSAGIDTVVLEKRDKPGGRAYWWEREGHVFDGGPTVITDPNCLAELWALSGRNISQDIELVPVTPFYRLTWPDGGVFDYTNEDDLLFRQIAAMNPDDVEGYKRFLAYSAGVYQEGYVKLGAVPFLDFKTMIRAAPALAKYQAWNSVYTIVSRFVKSEKLREALSFHTLLVGGNPMTTSGIYALIHKLERDGGVWFAKGGTNKLVQAMVKHFERLGGEIRLDDPVEEIETLGDRVTGVRTQKGWRSEVAAVASNGDVVHSYRDLLRGNRHGARSGQRLTRMRHSPGLFVIHFGTETTYPDVAHHTIVFGPRYRGLLDDIYKHGVLPADFSLYLHRPTATDPSMAPEGCSTFYVLAPVPHMGKLPIDWEQEGGPFADRILDELERRMLPGLRRNLRVKFHYAPPDFATDLNAHLGSAFSLEPVLQQSAWFRVHNRDDAIPNLYFVGAGTHPGAGIPGVVGSAKATATLMLDDLRR